MRSISNSNPAVKRQTAAANVRRRDQADEELIGIIMPECVDVSRAYARS
jgi:hypothetical protein